MNIFTRLRSIVVDSGTAGQVSSNAWNDSLDIKRTTTGDCLVKAGCCAISIEYFEIAAGDTLEIEAGAVLEIL